MRKILTSIAVAAFATAIGCDFPSLYAAEPVAPCAPVADNVEPCAPVAAPACVPDCESVPIYASEPVAPCEPVAAPACGPVGAPTCGGGEVVCSGGVCLRFGGGDLRDVRERRDD